MNLERNEKYSLGDSEESPQTMETFLISVEKRAYKTALLSTRRAADALDIVQDAMLQLVQKYADKASGEWPLVFQRILQNKIVDWHRAQSRTKKWFWQTSLDEDGEPEDPLVDLVASEKDPSEILERARDVETVMKVLESLPIRQRQAFLLRAWEGFDTQSTATAMGCSEGSVKTHYFRALQSMRSALSVE